MALFDEIIRFFLREAKIISSEAKSSRSMDILRTIGELYAERQRIEKIIGTLEELNGHSNGVAPKKRGRKFMDAAGRKAVSQRMKRYWAAKKEEVTQAGL